MIYEDLGENEEDQWSAGKRIKMANMEGVIGVRAHGEIAGDRPGDRSSSKPGQKMGLISDFFKSERGNKENEGGFGGVPEKIAGRSLRDMDGENNPKPQSATSSVRGLAMKKIVPPGAFGLSNRKYGGKKVRVNEGSPSGSVENKEMEGGGGNGNLMEEEAS